MNDSFFSLPSSVRQEYYDVVANNGVGSPQVAEVRKKYATHKQAELFKQYADAVDEVVKGLKCDQSLRQQ